MTIHVLFLCTHNSARSILAEAMLNHWASRLERDVVAFSAGSAPGGRVHPLALRVLRAAGIDATGARSKSWDDFPATDVRSMRIVVTVCDAAAAEACPLWPGAPVKVHWGFRDPSAAPDADRPHAFELTRQAIGYRVMQLLRLPLETMDDATLRQALDAIAHA